MFLGFHANLSDGQNLLAVRIAWCMDMISMLISLRSEKCSQPIITFLQFCHFTLQIKYLSPRFEYDLKTNRAYVTADNVVDNINLSSNCYTKWCGFYFFEVIIINFSQPVVIFKYSFYAATFDKDIGTDKRSIFVCT
jgi:hypothetical protein